MFDSTIIQQGYFTSDGNTKVLKIRSDMDWMEVINYTQYIGTTQDHSIKTFWQRGMGSVGLLQYHAAASAAISGKATAAGAFTLIDSNTYAGGAWIATTAGSNATQPLYESASTLNLYAGGIVRLKGQDQTELNGVDFSVDTVTLNTSFRLANTLATAPGVAAGAAGYWKLVAPSIEVYNLFTPSTRKIANITAAANAVVTTLVDHGYSVGSKVRFKANSYFGMTQIDNLIGTISAVTASTFTVDIDTTGFTAFKFPTAAEFTAAGALTYAEVTPVGESVSSTYANLQGDAVLNQGFIGMMLAGGALMPAGENTEVIYWRAGKSFGI